MMQAAPDIMLGWERIEAIDGETKDFYIRQLWDAKGSAEIELMKPPGLSAYGAICGWTLARAHARSGDAVAISSYLGAKDAFDRAMASFGETYADQNERDYRGAPESRTGRSDRRPRRLRRAAVNLRVMSHVEVHVAFTPATGACSQALLVRMVKMSLPLRPAGNNPDADIRQAASL